MQTEAERQSQALVKYYERMTDPSKVYGTQWGDPCQPGTPQNLVLTDWIRKCPKADKQVLEIGCGGGRWTIHLAKSADNLVAVDGAGVAESLLLLVIDRPFKFFLSVDGILPREWNFDYVFSFDTFVHFHKELFDAYVTSVGRNLKKGGIFHLHFANHQHDKVNGYDPVCFQYRDLSEITGLCKSVGLRYTGRKLELGGYGSLLIELEKS